MHALNSNKLCNNSNNNNNNNNNNKMFNPKSTRKNLKVVTYCNSLTLKLHKFVLITSSQWKHCFLFHYFL